MDETSSQEVRHEAQDPWGGCCRVSGNQSGGANHSVTSHGLLSDRYRTFVRLQRCGGGLILDGIAELSDPDAEAPRQEDPVVALRSFLETTYPRLLDVPIQLVGVGDGVVRYALVDESSPAAYIDVSANGVDNWAVSGWTGCADLFEAALS